MAMCSQVLAGMSGGCWWGDNEARGPR
jgi:hypothetical protein